MPVLLHGAKTDGHQPLYYPRPHAALQPCKFGSRGCSGWCNQASWWPHLKGGYCIWAWSTATSLSPLDSLPALVRRKEAEACIRGGGRACT